MALKQKKAKRTIDPVTGSNISLDKEPSQYEKSLSKTEGTITDNGKRKRRGTCCCGDSRCYKLSKRIAAIDPSRDGTVVFPSKPRVFTSDATSADREQQRTISSERLAHKRQRWIHYLGERCAAKVAESEAQANAKSAGNAEKSEKSVNHSNLNVSLAHFHPSIIAMFRRTDSDDIFGSGTSSAPNGSKLKFPLTIEYAFGKAIGMVDEDLFKNQDSPIRQFPVCPNYSMDELEMECDLKEFVGKFSVKEQLRDKDSDRIFGYGLKDEPMKQLEDFHSAPGYVSSSMAISIGMKRSRDTDHAADVGNEQNKPDLDGRRRPRRRKFSTEGTSDGEYAGSHKENIIMGNLSSMSIPQVAALIAEYDKKLRDKESLIVALRNEMNMISDSYVKMERNNLTMKYCANRSNLTSDEWHASHPEAAKYLFGFATWNDAKNSVDISAEPKSSGNDDEEGRVNAPLTALEQHLVTRMHVKKKWEMTLLGYIWGKSRFTIERVLQARAPAVVANQPKSDETNLGQAPLPQQILSSSTLTAPGAKGILNVSPNITSQRMNMNHMHHHPQEQSIIQQHLQNQQMQNQLLSHGSHIQPQIYQQQQLHQHPAPMHHPHHQHPAIHPPQQHNILPQQHQYQQPQHFLHSTHSQQQNLIQPHHVSLVVPQIGPSAGPEEDQIIAVDTLQGRFGQGQTASAYQAAKESSDDMLDLARSKARKPRK